METITMRCFTPGFCNLRYKSLLGLALALAVGPVFAKDTAPEIKQVEKGKASQVHSEQVVIPECLEKLKLSSEQQEKSQEIVGNYDKSTGQVWHEFGTRYMQAIKLESSLLAAIEDNLTEGQRQQVREQRRKTARHEKDIASTNTKTNQAAVKPKEETTRPTTAAEEGLAVIEVSLTDEQEAIADKVQENYRAQLRSLNRDIQGLHTRLVSLEADKLVEIEKVLTKDQLSQLRTSRQSAPANPKVVMRKTELKTAE
jgi:hypothetical protein